MRLLAVANIEKLENTSFLVINLYGQKGYLIDQIIGEYDANKVPEIFASLIKKHGNTLDCWTSNRELYGMTLNMPGVGGVLKHRDQTAETAGSLKDAEEILRDLYEIEPLVSKPLLPAWRKRLFLWSQKLADKLRSVERYEI